MRVIIETEVFAAPHAALELISLCAMGWHGRHRVQVEDYEAPAFRKWMMALPEDQRQECAMAFDMGVEEDAREPSRIEVRIAAVAESLWQHDPPRITLGDAHSFLHDTFDIVVEDGVSDRAFLLAMATEEQRAYIEQREKNRFLRFVHGGGIPRIREPIGQRKRSLAAALGCFVLFDSDALRPGQPSPQSAKIAELCAEPPTIEHHQLARRAIENYLPVDALHVHVYRPPRRKRTHVKAFEALCRLRDEQRFHYNMKAGFDGDAGRIDDPGTLYDILTPADRDALASGFGERIARLFEDGSTTVGAVRKDAGWQEINPRICRMIERVR